MCMGGSESPPPQQQRDNTPRILLSRDKLDDLLLTGTGRARTGGPTYAGGAVGGGLNVGGGGGFSSGSDNPLGISPGLRAPIEHRNGSLTV